MSRPPLARERVLDAFEHLLAGDGARAATLEATARSAGVSKGGLLYHFASKEALEAGLVARLGAQVDEDVAAIGSAPEGPIDYFLRTSVAGTEPMERTMVAVSRLAQGGSTPAAEALRDTLRRWRDALRPHLADETALDLVLLVSEGLYHAGSLDSGGLPSTAPTGDALDRLIALVQRAATTSSATAR